VPERDLEGAAPEHREPEVEAQERRELGAGALAAEVPRVEAGEPGKAPPGPERVVVRKDLTEAPDSSPRRRPKPSPIDRPWALRVMLGHSGVCNHHQGSLERP